MDVPEKGEANDTPDRYFGTTYLYVHTDTASKILESVDVQHLPETVVSTLEASSPA